MVNMTAEEALALMESAKDVYQWNQFRRLISYNLNPKSLPAFLGLIDATGMIRKIAQANNWPKVYTFSYGWIINSRD